MKRTLFPFLCTGVLSLISPLLTIGLCSTPAAEVLPASAVLAKAVPGDLRALKAETDGGTLLLALQAQMRAANPAEHAALELALLAVAVNGEATLHGRRAACAVLAGFASEAALAPLGRLLVEDGMSRSARAILEPMPGGGADGAFLDALGKTSGETRLGIVNSLGVRRVAAAVEPLVKLARGPDAALAKSSVRALGAIGDEMALVQLDALDSGGPLTAARLEALLVACERLIAGGNVSKDVLGVLEDLRAEKSAAGVCAGAWRVTFAAEPRQTVARVRDLLASDEPKLRLIGAQALDLVTDDAAAELAGEARAWAAESKALLIAHLSARGIRAVAPLARVSLDSPDSYLRETSIAAIGRVGDASDLEALAGVAAEGESARFAAIDAVVAIPDPAVNRQLLREFQNPNSGYRNVIPGILARRGHVLGIPALLTAAPLADRAVAAEIYRSVGAMGETSATPLLLEQWVGAKEADRPAIELAVVAIGRSGSPDAVIDLLTPWLGGANQAKQSSAVRMVGAIGGLKALELLQPFILSAVPDVGALRALLTWSGAEAMPLLQGVVLRNDLEIASRRSAWRSLLRVTSSAMWHSRIDGLFGFQTCMAAAFQQEDRVQVVEALARHKGSDVEKLLREWTMIPSAREAAREALQAIEEKRRESGRGF